MQYFLEKVFPTLLGTLTGAVLAFGVKKYQDQEAESARQKGAALVALFTITQYLNYLLTLEQHLAEWRDPKHQEAVWLGVPELWDFTELPEMKISDLAFLLQDRDPNLLGALVMTYQKVVNLAGSIQRRNEQKLRAKNAFEASPGFTVASAWPDPVKAAKGILHERLQIELQLSAESVLESSHRTLTYCQKVGRDLEFFLNRTWPDENFPSLPKELPGVAPLL